MKCDYKDMTWLPHGDGCPQKAAWVVTSHYLGLRGQVATGHAGYYCGQHMLLPFSTFLADEGKKTLGVTVMRFDENDQIGRIGQ